MSGSSMLTALVVLSKGGVAEFGIFSFIQVISVLISGVFMTLLHRQMMLEISSSKQMAQRKAFRATIVLEFIGLSVFLMIVGALYALFSFSPKFQEYQGSLIFSAAYIVLFVVYDAFKQFSYTTENQIYSLKIAIIFLLTHCSMLAYIVFFSDAENIVEITYFALTMSLLAGVVANGYCLSNLYHSEKPSIKFCNQTFTKFFEQGRFSLFGMAVTWVQNQSMNPFLMIIGGPVVAGYFSVGRLLIMPVAVVTQGLVNSSTPNLRRLFNASGSSHLKPKVTGYIRKTLAFSAFYFSALLLAHLTGLFEHFIPNYSSIKWFLLFWIALSVLTTTRFWNGQYFVVSMQFKFLLRVSVLSASVTVIGMTFFGLYLDSIIFALSTVIISECIILAIYFQKQKTFLEG